MATELSEIVNEALRLPEADRAALAERMIASLEGRPDADIDAAWREENVRRLDEADSGKVAAIPWEEFRGGPGSRIRRR